MPGELLLWIKGLGFRVRGLGLACEVSDFRVLNLGSSFRGLEVLVKGKRLRYYPNIPGLHGGHSRKEAPLYLLASRSYPRAPMQFPLGILRTSGINSWPKKS